MAELTLKLELCSEDRKRIDALISSLIGVTRQRWAPTAEPAQPEPVKAEEPPVDAVSPYTEEPAESEQAEAPAPLVPTVTMAELRHKVTELCAAGQKEAVKAIINAHAAKVTALPESVWDSVMRQLLDLEA